MIFDIKINVGGSFFPIGHVVADSKEAALGKLDLAEMPGVAYLSESTEVTGFDQLMTVLRDVDYRKFELYWEKPFEEVRKQ